MSYIFYNLNCNLLTLISGGVLYGLTSVGLSGTPTIEDIIYAMPNSSILILEPSETSDFITAHNWGSTVIFKINVSRNLILHYSASNYNSIIRLGRFSSSADSGKNMFMTELTGTDSYK